MRGIFQKVPRMHRCAGIPPWDMLPGMIGRLGMLISHLFRWLIPDPFVIAILLSVVTVVGGRVPVVGEGEKIGGR